MNDALGPREVNRFMLEESILYHKGSLVFMLLCSVAHLQAGELFYVGINWGLISSTEIVT